MKRLFTYSAPILLLAMLTMGFVNKGSLAPGGPVKQDSVSVLNTKPISRDELVYMVDSILDLDSISPAAIEMINKYNDALEKETLVLSKKATNSKLGMMPAGDMYESFDVEHLFTPSLETTLPDLMDLVIQNDSLGTYTAPICGIVTSNYGWRDKRMHKGSDIDLEKGDKVLAAFDGMVRIAKRGNGYGNVVIVRHYNGLETVYAHLSKIKVKTGQVVTSGTLLGLGGATGHATGTHLHFEVRYKGHALNPANFFSFEEGKVLNDTLTIRKSKYGIAAFPSDAEVYTVQRGDSWYEIAKCYGLTSQQMKSLNGTDKRFYLKVGQKIRIN